MRIGQAKRHPLHNDQRALPCTWLRRCAMLVVSVYLLSSCGSGSDDGGPQAPPAGFELSLATASVPVMQGGSGLLRVGIVRREGFDGAIEIKLASPPAGVSGASVIAENGEIEARLPLRFAAELPRGALAIVVNGSAGATVASGTVQLDVRAAQPRSQALIQTALDAGRIDLGTSLLYRTYAAFGSAKLPAEFVGSGPEEEDLALFADIERERPSLPQSTLDKLQPFMLRPADPLSVFNAGLPAARKQAMRQRPMAADAFADHCPGAGREWISLRSAKHPVRAFALCLGTPADDLRARNELLKVIAVVDKAYGLMADSMGPAIPDLWGDSAIDVYVVPDSADAPREDGNFEIERYRGVAITQPPYAGRTSSGYVMLPRWRLALSDYFFTVIHELFHVLQYAHNRTLVGHWFVEASASWAQVYFNRAAGIDPHANHDLHRERFGGFQSSPYGLLSTEGDNEYYSYVWPLFMEQEIGPESIFGAWQTLGFATNGAEATDAIDNWSGGFQGNFRKFALRGLNKPFGPADPLPRTQRYVSLDSSFPDGELLPVDRVKSRNYDVAPGAQRLEFDRTLEPLSAVYFKLSVTDATVKKVVFDLSGLQGGGLDLDAIVRIDDEYEAAPRDLNGKSELTFCLDDPKERLDQILFVVGNHQSRAGSNALAEIGVTGETTPCNTVWEGSTVWETRDAGYESTVAATIVFEYDESAPPSNSQPFRLRSGNGTYIVKSEVSPICQMTGKGLGNMNRQALDPRVPGSTLATLELFPVPPPTTYRALGATAIEFVWTDCNGKETRDQTVINWLNVEGPGSYFVSDDGNTLEGAQDVRAGQFSSSLHWKLVRARR